MFQGCCLLPEQSPKLTESKYSPFSSGLCTPSSVLHWRKTNALVIGDPTDGSSEQHIYVGLGLYRDKFKEINSIQNRESGSVPEKKSGVHGR